MVLSIAWIIFFPFVLHITLYMAACHAQVVASQPWPGGGQSSHGQARPGSGQQPLQTSFEGLRAKWSNHEKIHVFEMRNMIKSTKCHNVIYNKVSIFQMLF
jgi:hypothetical protein